MSNLNSDHKILATIAGVEEINNRAAEQYSGGITFSGNTYDFEISGNHTFGSYELSTLRQSSSGFLSQAETVREKIGAYDEIFIGGFVPNDYRINSVTIGQPGEKFRLTPRDFFFDRETSEGKFALTTKGEVTVDGGVTTEVNFFAPNGFAINKVG